MIKSQVETAITERLKDFKNIKSLKSLYKIESDTNKGYDGRQLLEMFQNCEDEGASIVEIFFDSENKILRISNDGEKSFSLKGYDSLLYPGLSSKVSSGYIGNKGLGFRSIINWAEEIRIMSNNFILEFKEEYKKKVLLEDLQFSEEALDEIRKERGYKSDIYPMPFLNCGKVLDEDIHQSYTTSIEVKYKEGFEQDIIKQIEGISEETLIFLNNLNTVIFSGNKFNHTIEVERKSVKNHNIVISQGKKYYVIEDEGFIDPDFTRENNSIYDKKYTVKIAFSDNLELKGNYLFNYFKTQIPFEFPFIAHASLELDQNRNHATEAKENEFVFNKLFQLHLKLIEILKEKYHKSWLPYRTIATEDYNVYQTYESIVCNNWEQISVYPTFNGNYLKKDDASYISNNIADFIDRNQIFNNATNNIVVKCDDSLQALKYINQVDDITSVIENIAVDLGIKERAELIKIILDEFKEKKFSVLIDESNSTIESTDFVFTDKTQANKDLKVPSYSNISFINSDLYASLVDILEIRELGDDVSRNMADVLSQISDVHSFEPQTVIKKIISETNNFLSGTEDKDAVIKEFFKVLFFNYRLRDNIPKLDYSSTIPCLNQNGGIIDIKKLVFSSEYLIGKQTSEILGNIYGPENLLADPNRLGIIDTTIEFEEFLSWLGVNDCFVFETLTSDVDSSYLLQAKRYTEWKDVSSYKMYNIVNLKSIFTDKNVNNLILWFSKDKQIKEVFKNFTSGSSKDEVLLYNKNKKTQPNFVNYIHYQIENRLNIKNYLISSKRSEWFNPFIINYEFLQEKNPLLEKKEVDRILRFFGAKDSFTDLDINYLGYKLEDLADKKNYSGAQVFYKNLVAHYKVNGKTFSNPSLYAKKGEEIVVEKANNIYFSDRIILPPSVTNIFPILYFPSRAGGAQAIKLFGLNDLSNLNFVIENDPILHNIQDDFIHFLNEIKPFILSFRLEKLISQTVKEDQVRRLNSVEIYCCTEIECSIEGNSFSVQDFNYIVSNDIYYFKIPKNVSIEELRGNKFFADNLSDLFLKLFDIHDEKRLFETIIRQSNDDNLYDIQNNLGEGIYEEALLLLGQVSIRLSIWKAIFKVKNIEIPNDLNEHNLDDFVADNLTKIESKDRFYNHSSIEDLQIILNIFKKIDVDLEQFNKVSDIKISFHKIFESQLVEFYNSIKKNLKNSIWHILSEKERADQSQFLYLLKKIENLLNDSTISFNDLNPDLKAYVKKLIDQNFQINKPSLDFASDIEYDTIEINNNQLFSIEELSWLKKDVELESLKYFDNNVEYLKGKILELQKENKSKISTSSTSSIDKAKEPEVINDFAFDTSVGESSSSDSYSPWLASRGGELSDDDKKKLGTDVEIIVYQHLKKQTNVSNVEHIAKTDEGLHYDITYYCLDTNKTKYVECKYYNGRSFILTADEKDFGFANSSQYEIWLVDSNSKIYPIKSIDALGVLKPKDYVINFRVKSKV